MNKKLSSAISIISKYADTKREQTRYNLVPTKLHQEKTRSPFDKFKEDVEILTQVPYNQIPVGTERDLKGAHIMHQYKKYVLVAVTEPDPEYLPHLRHWGPDKNNFKIIELKD